MKLTSPSKPALQELFDKHTANVYGGMVSRLKERKNKNGRILRVGRTLDFTLADFRGWVMMRFAHDINRAIQCAYCSKPIDVGSFCADHDVPINRGGSASLTNVVLCDEDCNNEKGQMYGEEFRMLNEFLDTRLALAARDIRARLRMGSGYRRMAFFAKKSKNPKNSKESKLRQLEIPDDF